MGADLGSRLDHLEELVDELIKDKPQEQIVKIHMKAAGLVYSADPLDCMNQVLTAIESARTGEGKTRGKDL